MSERNGLSNEMMVLSPCQDGASTDTAIPMERGRERGAYWSKLVNLQSTTQAPIERAISLPATHLVVLGVFCFALILAGGSSRFDASQIAMLRPLAALLLIPALWFLERDDLRRAPVVLVLVGLWLVWMVFQLIPLPFDLWHQLPARDAIRGLDVIVGLDGVSRPISVAPFRGWNSVFALIVPICALLIALSFKLNPRQLLLLIAAFGVFDAALGLLQVLDGEQSPLYLYAITNRGFPVGIFANENHSALLSAMTLVVIARLGLSAATAMDARWLRLAYVPAFILVLLAVLISGSRAGLVFALMALGAGGTMAWLERWGQARQSGRQTLASDGRVSRLLSAVALTIPFGLIAAFLVLDRTPAFEDILARSSFEDLRWSIWPFLKDMMQTHWLFGTGFGSFDKVYQIYEPTDLLMRAYVNQAHNDWAQVVIEGGLPAVMIAFAAIIWLAGSIRSIWSRRKAAAIFWLAIFAILGAASLVDYPLRTPIIQSLALWLALVLADDKNG
jgi:O-antigen ligase